jgi:uncharacterized membrane protein
MNSEEQIKEWVDSGIITSEQAKKMLFDVAQKSKEEKSNKLIVAISTIGSILLGIGAILFVASNWRDMPNVIKILLLTGSTFGAYYLGYSFKYEKQNLPKVGASLFFLGALLFGASLFLIAQMYNINANNHTLVLVWLIGVLPLVYTFVSESIAALSALLFLMWTGLFIFRNNHFDSEIIILFPVIYLFAGAMLFSIGGLHYFLPAMQKIARMFRLAGLKICMFSLFLLTFDFFSGSEMTRVLGESYSAFNTAMSQITTSIFIFAVLAIIGLAENFFFNPAQSKTNNLESGAALALVLFTLFFFFNATGSSLFVLLYNLIFALLAVSLILTGYQKADMSALNMGMFWLSAFIIAKYFDFFWDLMDRSIFFLIGGLIFVLGGIALEQKRRKLKESFTQIK